MNLHATVPSLKVLVEKEWAGTSRDFIGKDCPKLQPLPGEVHYYRWGPLYAMTPDGRMSSKAPSGAEYGQGEMGFCGTQSFPGSVAPKGELNLKKKNSTVRAEHEI